jgi:hypothetical protein
VAGPEEIRMTEGQFRRHHALGEQVLRSVQIGEQGIQERARCATPSSISRHSCAVSSSGSGSSTRGDRALRIGVDVVGHAVLDDQRRASSAPRRTASAPSSAADRSAAPMRAHDAVYRAARRSGAHRSIGFEASVGHLPLIRGVHLRRSSVNGNSGSTDLGRYLHRARRMTHAEETRQRRLSASKELTGNCS